MHVSTNRRAEVVLFGYRPALQGPCSFLAGEIAVNAGQDETCTITRIPLRGEQRRKRCSLALEDVLRTIAELGCAYPDVVEFLQHADGSGCLTCKVAFDAMPKETSVFDLVKAGKALKSGEPIEKTILRPQAFDSSPIGLGTIRPGSKPGNNCGGKFPNLPTVDPAS